MTARKDARVRARRVRVRTMDPLTLGARLRTARIAAGLTQSEICDGIASPAYLSRVEAGQRRPSLELLGGFARRVAVPIDDLLDLGSPDAVRDIRLTLARAQLHLTAGDTRVALSTARNAERQAREASLDDAARSARLIQARANLGAGNAGTAADLLVTDALNPDQGAHSVRVLVTFAACQLALGAPGVAAEAGRRASGLVSEHALEGLPEAVEAALVLSSAQLANDDRRAAAATCAAALEQVPEVSPTDQLSTAFTRASESEYRSGALDDAMLHAERAVLLLDLAAYRANIVELRARAGKNFVASGKKTGHKKAQ